MVFIGPFHRIIVMLNLSKVPSPIVCVTCDGKGWALEANPFNPGDVSWEECFVCNGLGRTHSQTKRWTHASNNGEVK
jgi:DnaJ-class molecular chaperone